jgi:hypothetical protein
VLLVGGLVLIGLELRFALILLYFAVFWRRELGSCAMTVFSIRFSTVLARHFR